MKQFWDKISTTEEFGMRMTAHREVDPVSGEVVSESFHDYELTIDSLKERFARIFTLDE